MFGRMGSEEGKVFEPLCKCYYLSFREEDRSAFKHGRPRNGNLNIKFLMFVIMTIDPKIMISDSK